MSSLLYNNSLNEFSTCTSFWFAIFIIRDLGFDIEEKNKRKKLSREQALYLANSKFCCLFIDFCDTAEASDEVLPP